MKRALLASVCLMSLSACGNLEGDWEGDCENPATGELRSFDIDVDEDKGGEFEGFAYMDIVSPTGDLSRIGCNVTGTSEKDEIIFNFECENGDEFTFIAERKGKNLLTYCDSNNEVELLLEPD
jgi:hypothetical protein